MIWSEGRYVPLHNDLTFLSWLESSLSNSFYTLQFYIIETNIESSFYILIKAPTMAGNVKYCNFAVFEVMQK